MELNGFVDVISKAFPDVIIQPGQHPDERGAMRVMLKHFSLDEPQKYIITNLPFSFDINDIKKIYHWKWGIETTFRYFKHANGILHFHCKKNEFLKMEILVIYLSLI